VGLAFTFAETILRTRGHVFLQLDSGGADERVLVAVGLIVVSTNAFTAGAASLPSPVDDGEDDWLWHSYLSLSVLAEVAISDQAMFQRQEIDSKAMRKVRPGEVLAFMAEIADVSDNAGTIDLMYGTRILFGI